MFIALLVLSLIGVVIALFARSERLAARVRSIESRLSNLEGTAAPPVQPPSTGVSRIPAPLPAASQTPATLAAQPIPAPAALPTPPPPAPSRTREEWEALIGGKLLNRVGALALIIGMGFFLKHAFDENWVTETFRVILGGAIGAGLLLLADRARRKDFAVFGQGLVGAGIAILYLSVYASFNYYSLVSQPVAFVLMAAVTVIAFYHAFRFDSLAVAFIGWLGGFLTPTLLSTGVQNEIGLFSYLLILDAGIIAVTRAREEWTALEPLAVLGTWTIYFVWWFPEYRSDAFAVTLFFLILFWGGFHLLDLLLALRKVGESRFRRLQAWGNGFLATVALLLLMWHSHPSSVGLALLIFAAAYGGSAAILFPRRAGGSTAFGHFALSASILLACAIFAEMEEFRIPLLLEAEAILLLILGLRLAERRLQIAGELLVAVGAVALAATAGAFGFTSYATFVPIWNERAFAWLLLAAGYAVGSRLRREAGDAALGAFGTYCWIISLLLFVAVEISDIFMARLAGADGLAADVIMFHRLLAVALAWCAAGFLLLISSRGSGNRSIASAGVWVLLAGAIVAAVRGMILVPLEAHLPIANFRTVVFLLIAMAFLYGVPVLRELKSRVPWLGRVIVIFRTGAVLMIFFLVTAEISNAFGKALGEIGVLHEEDPGERETLRNMRQLALSGGWLLYSSGLMILGLAKRLRSLRLMAIVLFGLTTLKVILFDLSFLELSYRYISFIGLGVILLAASYLYRRYREIITEPSVE